MVNPTVVVGLSRIYVGDVSCVFETTYIYEPPMTLSMSEVCSDREKTSSV
jgi:hypothetical protein